MVLGEISVAVNETPTDFCWAKPTLGEICFNDVQLQQQISDTATHFPGSKQLLNLCRGLQQLVDS